MQCPRFLHGCLWWDGIDRINGSAGPLSTGPSAQVDPDLHLEGRGRASDLYISPVLRTMAGTQNPLNV